MKIAEKFRLVLSTSLREDGVVDDGDYLTMEDGPSLADSFEYVMHGKVYRIDSEDRSGESGQL